MDEDFLRLEGIEPGETSIVLAGIHGDERCGIEAIQKLLPQLQITKGVVYIGYGNPRAIKENVRFTEANLNRMFKDDTVLSSAEKTSYEYARAQYIKTFMQKADVLLDIHASFTPQTRAFIICEPNASDLAAQLPFNHIVSGFDAIEPGGTDYYMNSIGKTGISVECGYLGDPKATEKAEETILSFLTARGHIPGKPLIRMSNQSHIQMDKHYLTETDSFRLSRPFADFEDISKGMLIGIDGESNVYAEKDSVILFARDRQSKGEEAFLLGEKR